MSKLLSIEGISGTGKTFLSMRLSKMFDENTNIVFLKEIFDEVHVGLNEKIFSALYHTGDRFFDMGLPLTETMLLLSRLMYQYESIINDALKQGKIVIEDRGIDSILVAQAVMINKKYGGDINEIANDIYNFANNFIKVPDKTFLLYGDYDFAIKRAEQRDNQRYTKDETEILKQIEKLFIYRAGKQKNRFVTLNIKKINTDEIIDLVLKEILNEIRGE